MTNPAQFSTDEASDECLTPRYAVIPIVKHLKARGFKRVWCPFDKAGSFFVRVLQDAGFIVLHSHLEDGVDFFKITKIPDVDCIVSNPPFSKKTAILKRLFEINLPFAMILPLNTLQSVSRVDLFIDYGGVEMLCFNRRICFYTWGKLDSFPQKNRFPTAYFCRNVLPQKLMFENLEIIQEPYSLEAML